MKGNKRIYERMNNTTTSIVMFVSLNERNNEKMIFELF